MYKPGAKITSLNELAEQEFIFFSSKNNPKLYHCGWFMSWQFRVAARYIRWGYLYYAVKPGFKILDTHLGSGSSRIAAYDAGLDFVGYEIDKDYFDKQEQRFQKHISQMSLFVD